MFTNNRIMIKVSKTNLLLLTGIIWFSAALILLFRAYSWIDLLSHNQILISGIITIVLALIKIHFVFHKLTIKNIYRIAAIKEKVVSIFKFHVVKDQLLIVVMIVLGTLLRNSPIHKSYLFPVYAGIGIAMFYSSILYIKHILQKNS